MAPFCVFGSLPTTPHTSPSCGNTNSAGNHDPHDGPDGPRHGRCWTVNMTPGTASWPYQYQCQPAQTLASIFCKSCALDSIVHTPSSSSCRAAKPPSTIGHAWVKRVSDQSSQVPSTWQEKGIPRPNRELVWSPVSEAGTSESKADRQEATPTILDDRFHSRPSLPETFDPQPSHTHHREANQDRYCRYQNKPADKRLLRRPQTCSTLAQTHEMLVALQDFEKGALVDPKSGEMAAMALSQGSAVESVPPSSGFDGSLPVRRAQPFLPQVSADCRASFPTKHADVNSETTKTMPAITYASSLFCSHQQLSESGLIITSNQFGSRMSSTQLTTAGPLANGLPHLLRSNPSIYDPNPTSPLVKPGCRLNILGIDSWGTRSRVETQVKVRVQLADPKGQNVSDWAFVRLKQAMVLPDRWRKQMRLTSNEASFSAPKTDTLDLGAEVICASRPYSSSPVLMCQGCVIRERKRARRRKEFQSGSDPILQASSSPEFRDAWKQERHKILLFNSSPLIPFGSGEMALPLRITCYCRHHGENIGFQVRFSLVNCEGVRVAEGFSPPIMVADENKTPAHLTARQPSGSMVTFKENRDLFSRNAMDVSEKLGTPRHLEASVTQGFLKTSAWSEHDMKNPGGPNGLGRPYCPGQHQLGEDARNLNAGEEEQEPRPKRLRLQDESVRMSESASAMPLRVLPPPTPSVAPTTHVLPLIEAHLPLPLPDSTSTTAAQAITQPFLTTFEEYQTLTAPPFPLAISLQPFPLSRLPAPNSPLSLTQSPPQQSLEIAVKHQDGHIQTFPSTASMLGTSELIATDVLLGGRPPVKILSVIPSEGPVSGGIQVAVQGTGFRLGDLLTFGSMTALSTTYLDPRSLTCILPPSSTMSIVPVHVWDSLQHERRVTDVESCGWFKYYRDDHILESSALKLTIDGPGADFLGAHTPARSGLVAAMAENRTGSEWISEHPPSTTFMCPRSTVTGSSGFPQTLFTRTHEARRVGPFGLLSDHRVRHKALAGVRTLRRAPARGNVSRVRSRYSSRFSSPHESSRISQLSSLHDNQAGRGPLHLAAAAGWNRLVHYLLVKARVDVNPLDKNRMTPLALALVAGHVRTVRMLCRHGAGIGGDDQPLLLTLGIPSHKRRMATLRAILAREQVLISMNYHRLMPKVASWTNVDIRELNDSASSCARRTSRRTTPHGPGGTNRTMRGLSSLDHWLQMISPPVLIVALFVWLLETLVLPVPVRLPRIAVREAGERNGAEVRRLPGADNDQGKGVEDEGLRGGETVMRYRAMKERRDAEDQKRSHNLPVLMSCDSTSLSLPPRDPHVNCVSSSPRPRAPGPPSHLWTQQYQQQPQYHPQRADFLDLVVWLVLKCIPNLPIPTLPSQTQHLSEDPLGHYQGPVEGSLSASGATSSPQWLTTAKLALVPASD